MNGANAFAKALLDVVADPKQLQEKVDVEMEKANPNTRTRTEASENGDANSADMDLVDAPTSKTDPVAVTYRWASRKKSCPGDRELPHPPSQSLRWEEMAWAMLALHSALGDAPKPKSIKRCTNSEIGSATATS